MNHQPFSYRPAPDRHLPALFRQALAGPPRFSVRRLEAFDAPDALALAQRSADAPQAINALLALSHELEHLPATQPHRPQPLPLLLLDADAEPVMLLPLLRWRPATQPGHADLRAMATLAAPASHPGMPPPRRADWQMTVLQARALLRTVIAALPHDADLLLCHPLPPGTVLDTSRLRHLLADRASPHHLPGCAPVHPLSWRGMLALLRARLPTLPLHA